MLVRSGQGDGTAVFSLGALARGVVFSFAVTLLVALFLGIAVALTEWEGLSSGAHWFSYVSVALGGMLAAKHSRRYGWIHGAGVGLAYFAISAAAFQPDFEWALLVTTPWLVKGLGSAAAGALGGVIGINL
jgi:putative membrane protein, TIGR04086 family/integral membrane protein, TIGR04097 family